MINKKRQEIIDYLESGEKFSKVLISELSRLDLTCYEKRTYSSLLDALNGATELYCAMTEWPDNVVYINLQAENEPLEEELEVIIDHGYIQGFTGCMKAIQEGGFKGLEDKLSNLLKLTKESDSYIH